MQAVQFFRALCWLRWRLLVNALERNAGRDRLERFSRAVQQLGPIVVALLAAPAALALAAAGLLAGLWMHAPNGPFGAAAFSAVRIALLIVTFLVLAGPLIVSTGRELIGSPRFLLLPVPRRWLYLGEAAGGLADPWVAALVPMLLMVPAGLAWSGHIAAAAVALAAGACLLALLLGLGALSGSLVHLLLRDRRRGEFAMVVGILLLPILAMVPALTQSRQAAPPPLAERPVSVERRDAALPGWTRAIPSELYATAVARAPSFPALAALGALLGVGLGVHALSWMAHRRLLESPASGGAMRAGLPGRLWSARIPGLSRSASAVALAEIRLVLRSPRGRTALVAPLLFVALIGGLVLFRPESWRLTSGAAAEGLALASLAALVSIVTLQPATLNQFAIDRGGLLLQFLAPISDREILVGKAAAGGLLSAALVAVCLLTTLALLPGGPAGLWLAVALGAPGAYGLFAPAAAALSATLPRPAVLDRVGSASNPHQLAALLGLLALVVAAGPPVVLALVTALLFDRPNLAAVVVGIWTVLVYTGYRWLLPPLAALLAARRENLAQLAQQS